MVFSSLNFLFLFLPAVLALYFAVPPRFLALKNAILLVFSLAFYLYGEPLGIFVMLASITVNWLAARLMATESARRRKLVLIISVVLNLGLLCYYKYLGFAVENINRLFNAQIPLPEIIMPIGISFFTFQGMSYVFDVYLRRSAAQKNILHVATYISLFPQLVAGPIVRYETIASELIDRKTTLDGFAAGLRRFIVGLGKKMLLGNPMGELAAATFGVSAGTLSAGAAWLGALGYALHIYFDFSAYSDMAIGLGRMFGFTFCENFDHPYISRSVTEFWRRWHISLSTWFRDYVYIPLGGNRKGLRRQIVNLLIVWLLTGLWHGAAWNFVLWGLYYAVLLILEKLFLGKLLEKLWTPLRHLYALLAVLFGWVLFNASGLEQVMGYLGAMFGLGDATAVPSGVFLLGQYKVEFVLAAIFALPAPKRLKAMYACRTWFATVCDVALLFVLAWSVMAIVGSSFNPFIYFRF
ncbi:MAG: MBOAT family protein [Ruminococcaceae bacterium]|nr:MBOAT family protein [Oscillospiraceae bacterium]